MPETFEIADPKPGSADANKQGCRCPVIDNCYGRGAYISNGEPQYWINADCPLHGQPSPVAPESEP